MWKRVKRIGLLLMTGSVVLVVGLLILCQSSSFHQWLLQRIEREARDAGYQLSAQRLDFDIQHLKVSLDGLIFSDEGTNVSVARLAVDIPWNAFRGDIVKITSVEADGV